MKVLTFLNGLGIGGTEMAAARWSLGLRDRGHQVQVLAMEDGPRRAHLEGAGIEVHITGKSETAILDVLRRSAPDVVHAHVPGYRHDGELLGGALARMGGRRPKVVQTNVFGRLENRREDDWTDYRLFISWTSCVQAARRAHLELDARFFRHASVAVYPLDPRECAPAGDVQRFRDEIGVGKDDVLCGRLSRPDPNKWTDLALDAFDIAARTNPRLKLLLREPPPAVAKQLRESPHSSRYIILPATSVPEELHLTMSSLDLVLHTSSAGESFGYGLAEPMNLGKPAITHSVPDGDQAQLELVQHGRNGLITSVPATMANAIRDLADDPVRRKAFGRAAQAHIRTLADVQQSVGRVEETFSTVLNGGVNRRLAADLEQAREAGENLNRFQFGQGWREQLTLRQLPLKAARLFLANSAVR